MRLPRKNRRYNLKQRLIRKRRAQMRRKPNANIWYWGIVDGERALIWKKPKRFCIHLTFRPVKYHASAGFDYERNRFIVRPIFDVGINTIGWRAESVRRFNP